MTQTAKSRNGVSIRLTAERWSHIVEEHSELAGMREDVLDALENAERVIAGREGELLAIKAMESGKTMIVVYRETQSTDGFIITAFLTRRAAVLQRRIQLWPPKN